MNSGYINKYIYIFLVKLIKHTILLIKITKKYSYNVLFLIILLG
ncbi:protein of unknown function [Candidatus Nitrosacidococcus tergens]|uniref:Uncharacterized protein n=1 Tax=Candidatus Nitrosacidococcus tergens TaxID=553981 RepID=A0A7G1QAH3_9GAMM|nr:protein of unknown function [Candidatus Nitrosacidococcus tergens]